MYKSFIFIIKMAEEELTYYITTKLKLNSYYSYDILKQEKKQTLKQL